MDLNKKKIQACIMKGEFGLTDFVIMNEITISTKGQ